MSEDIAWSPVSEGSLDNLVLVQEVYGKVMIDNSLHAPDSTKCLSKGKILRCKFKSIKHWTKQTKFANKLGLGIEKKL